MWTLLCRIVSFLCYSAKGDCSQVVLSTIDSEIIEVLNEDLSEGELIIQLCIVHLSCTTMSEWQDQGHNVRRV